MVNKCCVFQCPNYNDAKSKQNGISFHKLPKEEPRRSEWLNVIPRKNGLIQASVPKTTFISVCSDHFKYQDYDSDPRLIRKRLNSGVIPSIFQGMN